MKKIVAIIFLTVSISSCGPKSKIIKASEIECYGTDTLNHTIYIGSDRTHHHFVYQKGITSGKWKVPKSELSLPETFTIQGNHQSRFIIKDDNGKISFIELKNVE